MLLRLWKWASERPNQAMKVAGMLMILAWFIAMGVRSVVSMSFLDFIDNLDPKVKLQIWSRLKEVDQIEQWAGGVWLMVAIGLLTFVLIRKRRGLNDQPE